MDKVQLFCEFALLQAKSKQSTVQFKVLVYTNRLPNSKHFLLGLHLDVVHVGIFQLFSKMRIFLQVLNDFPEVAVVVQAGVLSNDIAHTYFVQC